MNATYETIDLSALREALDAFAAAVRASQDDGVLDGARPLLLRLGELPALPDATSTSGWQAIRVSDEDGTRTISCWTEDVASGLALSGMWRASALETWVASAGTRYRASQRVAQGEVRFGATGEVEGAIPAGRDLRARSRAEFDRWIAAHPSVHWRCLTCGFENDSEVVLCVICDRTRGASADRSFTAVRELESARPSGAIAPSDAVMQLPPGLEDLLPPLTTAMPEPRPRASADSRMAATDNPGALLFDVALFAFSAANRDSLAGALRSIFTAEGQADRTDELLAARLPVVVAQGLSIAKARDVTNGLRAAGAHVEIQRGKPRS